MDNQVEMEREGADITAAHMLIPEETPSEIRKFFDGASVFLTGGSGFLGNLMIEKLLRVCSDIKRLYILIRPKKGKDPQQRLEEIFKDQMFERLNKENPKFYEKVSILLGDCEQPDLGLSEESKQILINEVSIVFHVAATVRFDAHIRKATYINVRGTRDVMKLSRKMKNLKALVHVSTAFSNCPNLEIDEKFYDNKMKGDKLIEIMDLLDDTQLDALTPSLIGEWPNTYTYTKAIAENVIREYGKNLPVSIVRPSIVSSTYKEPVAGWINNYYGVVGITLGAGIGILRTLHCNPDYKADIVPSDYCINSIITSAWIVGQSREKENNEVLNNVAFDDLKVEDNIPIFNYVCSQQNILTWRKYMKSVEDHGLKNPPMTCLWYYCFYLQKNKYVHLVSSLFLHFIPGVIVDTGLFIIGRKPLLFSAYKKISKATTAISYFTCKEWSFKNHNIEAIWKKLNPTDKRLFEFDMNQLVWNEYFFTSLRGGRVYFLKDPLDTLPAARNRLKKLKIVHYIVVTLFWLLVLKLVWMIISPFF